MLFRVFPKSELERLFEVLSVNRITGPSVKDTDSSGDPIYAFDWLYDFNDLAIHYSTTASSPKKYFLPYREMLSSFTVDDKGWQKHVDYNAYHPTVFFGLHACDINALNRLDKVMLDSAYPNPYYAAKRKNAFIIGIDCSPQSYCFCRSMGADTVLHGFDLFLTDLGEDYFAEIHTASAFEVLRSIAQRLPTDSDHAHYVQKTEQRRKQFTCHVDTTDLTRILDLEFQAEAWKHWGEKCLSCGSCAQVCPTCYCFGVNETVDLDLKGAHKEMQLYSCNLVDFAQVAGGHNFRPESHSRLKYRYYHKHRGFVEAFEESLCVGCGRCGQNCLAGITVPEVINSIRQEAQKNG